LPLYYLSLIKLNFHNIPVYSDYSLWFLNFKFDNLRPCLVMKYVKSVKPQA